MREICPRCFAALVDEETTLVCRSCGFSGAVRGAITDLRVDKNIDTALDLDSYDGVHNVSDTPSRRLFEIYQSIAVQNGSDLSGDILEIGAGTGNLTLGLAAFSGAHSISAGDVSERFLSVLAARAENLGIAKSLRLYLFDATSLPFSAATFDFIFGHSILHHLLDFERTLGEAHRLLRPGGIAVFAEPMMDTNALAYLAAELLVRIDSKAHVPLLSPALAKRLAHAARMGLIKRRNFETRGAQVGEIEDKFVFEQADFQGLAREIGFSRYMLERAGPVGSLSANIARRLLQFCQDIPDASQQIAACGDLLEPFATIYQASLRRPVPPLFGFNVFVR